MHQLETKDVIKWAGLAGLLVILVITVVNMPLNLGILDYRGYWSASYLLGQGENFSDDALLLYTEQTLTDFQWDFPVKTWNPPWVLVWLLPYTWFGFQIGANLWLLTNIAALFFSIVVSWELLFPKTLNGPKWLWIPFVAAVLFPSAIVALFFGQVNIMVLAGLTGFLFFYKRQQDIPAGLFLTLTTIKPHLVYLVVPILLLAVLRERRWPVLFTFGGVLIGSTLIAFLLRPTFLSDYLQSTSEGNLLAWETATAVTYISILTGWSWIRLIAIGLLPLTIILWFFKGRNWDLVQFSIWGVLASIITMPFGWSYDFVVLLFPITQLIVWLIVKSWSTIERTIVSLLFIAVYVIYYAQRVASPTEMFYFWVPLAVASLFIWAAMRHEDG
ncbi:MAG: glycosyltransferase family 87 protein [Chloroflexota bacterium]